MRLGVLWQTTGEGGIWRPHPNAYYRAIDPMKAMERRGHDVVWPSDARSTPDTRRLASCDVVHVYQSGVFRSLLEELARNGTAITYDNDDDFTAIPKESPHFTQNKGLRGHRIFADTAKTARLARWCTTVSEQLAQKYRKAGVERVEVIDNYVAPDLERPRTRHGGVVIGWIAAPEHRADAAQLKIADALRRLVDKHDDVRVECLGVDLRLPDRYRHDVWVLFPDLPRRTGGFDIGLAPLADTPWNQTRSDIKLKEYAASGVPWLASPIGPYVGLGEEQGGRLVPDDGWFDALDRLVSNGRERKRLARKAKKWAKGQTIEAVADRWERLFLEAAEG
jgi:glycosyltransferase involved in cell wall biosynthesis